MSKDTDPTSMPDGSATEPQLDVELIGVGAVFPALENQTEAASAQVDTPDVDVSASEATDAASSSIHDEVNSPDEEAGAQQGHDADSDMGSVEPVSAPADPVADQDLTVEDESDSSIGEGLAATSGNDQPARADEKSTSAGSSGTRKARSSTSVDAACAAAVEAAREALLEVVPAKDLGEHLGVERSGDRLAVHSFAATLEGYRGWVWKVLVARALRARVVTICDSWLEPGADAMLAPAWIPWADRLAPEDVRPTDRLPYTKDDVRLMDNRFCTDEDSITDVQAWTIDAKRPRVLSPEGLDETAQRWQKNDLSGAARSARQANAACSECGFFVSVSGVLGQQFGVCANSWSDADGSVVNVDYGCGAHSETDVDRETEPISEPVLDESGFEVVHD